MFFGFFIDEDAPVEPPAFSEDTELNEDSSCTCFLKGGNLRCRECPWSGLCDWQDSYEYENESEW